MKNLYIILVLLLFLNVGNFSQNAWEQVGNGLNGTVRTLTVGSNGQFYAGGDFNNSGNVFVGKVAYTNGSEWYGTDTMDTFNNSVHTLHYFNNYLYAGGHFIYYIRKYNISNLWTNLGNVHLNEDVNSIVSLGSDIYAAGGFTYCGNDRLNYVGKWNGSNWSQLDTGLNATASALAIIGSNLYVGGSFTNTYGGMNLKRIGMWNGHWNQLGTGILNGWVNALAVDGNDLYVAGSFSLSVSNGVAHNIAKWNGSSWSMVGTPLASGLNGEVTCIMVSGGSVYAGGYFTSTHGGSNSLNRIAKWDGTSWQPIGPGFNAPVRSLYVSDNYLYAGGDFTSTGTTSVQHIAKWSTPIGIQQLGTDIPAGYSLSQNYPNPFNPKTKISFEIPAREKVKIEICDLKGQMIMELINEELGAGIFEVVWDASGYSSGIYFFRIKAGKFTETKKMILIK